MNIEDYEFHTDDEVITTDGKKGRIVGICCCSRCQERGFHEPFWICEDTGETYYIDNFVAQEGFDGYYKIGKYIFNDLDKAKVL